MLKKKEGRAVSNRLGWMLGLAALLILGPAVGAEQTERTKKPGDAQALAKRIDHLITQRWVEAKVEPATPADDAEFMRRVYLDLAGRIPSVAEARTFLEDTRA